MQFKTATWYHFTPVKGAKLRQLDGAICWPRCEGRWTSVIFSRYLTVHGQIQRTLTLRFAITGAWISIQTKLSHMSVRCCQQGHPLQHYLCWQRVGDSLRLPATHGSGGLKCGGHAPGSCKQHLGKEKSQYPHSNMAL